MNLEPTLSLREVARHLAAMRSSQRGKIDDGKLLALLKAGELKAGFEFPGLVRRWIPIPKDYWVRISSDKFRSIRRGRNKRMTGTYKVRIGRFATEYLQTVNQDIGEYPKSEANSMSMAQPFDELRNALAISHLAFEVVIQDKEWKKYIQSQPMQPGQNPRGRKQKKGWSHLAPLLAAYMMTLDKRPSHSQDHDSLATNILAIAQAQAISDLPKRETLQKTVAQVFSQAEEFSKT
jgi:hypothetical protein